MVGQLIFRGFIIGILAGMLAFGWARTFGEPSVAEAVAFESARGEARDAATLAAGKTPEADDPEMFSRDVQSGAGLLTGMVAVGAGLGCLFAVLFAFGNGRMGTLGPGATSAWLAFLGLMTVYGVPALKYPANPPSVGGPDTIKYRTALYFLMLAISISSTIGAWYLARRLKSRLGDWNGSVVSLGAYLIVLGIVFRVMPDVNEVPVEFPAVTLWHFRMASLGIQSVLWGSIGVMFGCLTEWSAKPQSS